MTLPPNWLALSQGGAQRAAAAVSRDVDQVHLNFEGTDINRAVDDRASAALVGGDARGDEGDTAGGDGGAAGQEGHGLCGAAVILQGAEERIDVEQVGGHEAAAAR